MTILFDSSKSGLTQVIEISKELPEWFTTAALENIKKDFKSMNVLKAKESHKLVGFAIFELKAGEIEIHWLAVRKNKQRKGIGAKIMGELEKLAKEKNIPKIMTITLDESINYEPYELTRKFYFSQGFVKERVVPKYWGNQNVALFMAKKLV